MATLAPPGKYAFPDAPVISATMSFTGKSFTLPLYSPAFRAYAIEAGVAPASIALLPGSTRLAGSFGQRRGRRFLNEATL